MLLRNMLPVNVISYLLLFLLMFCAVYPFPSVPLNERNKEDITWQVWLLVDDQNNQQRVHNDVIPRRRITPKSVFIAPSNQRPFSIEDLEPCPDGYTSNSRGNCVEIVKLDEDKNLEYLLQKIPDLIGTDVDYEEEYEIEEMDVPNNPQHVSIDLPDADGDYSNDSPQEETNFAIMFTPVENNGKNEDEGNIKLDKRAEDVTNPTTIKNNTQNVQNEQRFESTETTTNVDGIRDTTTLKEPTTTLVDDINDSTTLELKNQEIITYSQLSQDSGSSNNKYDKLVDEFREPTTTYMPTTEFITYSNEKTTFQDIDTTTFSTIVDESVTESTTQTENKPESIKIIIDTHDVVTTDLIKKDLVTTEPQFTTTEGISFTTPPNIEFSSSLLQLSSTTPKITTYHPRSTRVTTYHPHLSLEHKNEGLVRFPDQKSELRYQESTQEPKIDLVKFPDMANQQESIKHHTRDVGNQFGNFVNDLTPSESKEKLYRSRENTFKFPHDLNGFGRNSKDFDIAGQQRLMNNENHYQYSIDRSTSKPLVRRNRDKQRNFLSLPPDLMARPHNKPLVIRFSKKLPHHMDTSKFKTTPIYRSLPPEDLSYLFGHRRTNRQTKSSKIHVDRGR